MFQGERNTASQRSGLAGAYYNNNSNNSSFSSDDSGSMDLYHQQHNGGNPMNPLSVNTFRAAAAANHGPLTPPDDYDFPIADKTLMASYGVGANPVCYAGSGGLHEVTAWLEIWDYAGGSSFRAFVTEDLVSSSSGQGEDTKSLFVFFDAHVMGRDLKKAYVYNPSTTSYHRKVALLTLKQSGRFDRAR